MTLGNISVGVSTNDTLLSNKQNAQRVRVSMRSYSYLNESGEPVTVVSKDIDGFPDLNQRHSIVRGSRFNQEVRDDFINNDDEVIVGGDIIPQAIPYSGWS